MFSLLFLAKPTVLLQVNMFCGSRAEVVLRPIFCYLTLSSVYWNLGLLNFAKFVRPGLFGSIAEVVLRVNFAKIFTPWYCLHFVLWLHSRSCFTPAIFVT